MEYVDSSDDEEEDIIDKIKPGYFGYIADSLINLEAILSDTNPLVSFDYKIGVALQHLADRFFRHTEVGEQYRLLKIKYININTEIYNQFIKDARLFFTNQSDLLSIDSSIPNEEIIQLFNHLFTDRVPLTPKVKVISTSEEYKTELLRRISQDLDFVSAIKATFPLKSISLIQSSDTTNAAEVLAFCKLINRYTKNELKVIISTSQNATEVDKSIQIQFKAQQIRDLNESWILRPKNKKAQNKIPSLGNYSDIFEYITQDNKKSIINRMFDLLLNKANLNTPDHTAQQTDKLTQLLFVSELARNKAAVFTTLMFLNLLEREDISQKSTKSELINLFPMALAGAMQSSRDLINEPLLENTHSMDFNHEKQTHINLLKAQSSIWCAYDKELMQVRNLLILSNEKLRNTLDLEPILEYGISYKEFLPSSLSSAIETLAKQYKEVLNQNSLEEKKKLLKELFQEELSKVNSSNERSINQLTLTLFYNKASNTLAEFKFSKDLIKPLNDKIIEALKRLYEYCLKAYNIKGFAKTGKIKVIQDEQSNDKTSKGLKRDNEELEETKNKIPKGEAMSDVHDTAFYQSQQEDDITTHAMGSESNLKSD